MNSELSIKFLWQLKVSTKFNSLNVAFDFFSFTYFVIFWRVVCLWYLKMCIINVMVNNWIDCSHFCMFSFLVLLEFNLFMNKQTDCHPHVSPLMHWCLALGIEKVMAYIILMVLFFRKKIPWVYWKVRKWWNILGIWWSEMEKGISGVNNTMSLSCTQIFIS